MLDFDEKHTESRVLPRESPGCHRAGEVRLAGEANGRREGAEAPRHRAPVS
jgi:hypothetical protein